jgi:hypothetical protein
VPAAERRLPVRFDEPVWQDAVAVFAPRTRAVAQRARTSVEREGVALQEVQPCDAHGPDHTALAGCAKLYVPLGDEPASRRPFAFVLRLIRERDGLAWAFVAFGPRHPRPGVRSVYERAHRQLHGRFPPRG